MQAIATRAAVLAAEQKASETFTAIVLVNWNAWSDCIDCLDSLVGGVTQPWHIYLVDNASADGSLDKIAAWCANPVRPQDACDFPGVVRHSASAQPTPLAVRRVDAVAQSAPALRPGCGISLVQSGANRGFAGGNNVGIRLGLAEGAGWFWVLNTDTVVHRDALASLLERARSAPNAGMVGSTLLYHDEPETVQAHGGASLDRDSFAASHLGIGTPARSIPTDPTATEARMDYVVGASILVSRQFVDQIGLMQEDYFLYFEELDWAARAGGKFRLCWAPQSVVWHKVGRSSGQSDFASRLLLRNRLRFVQRFYPSRLAAVRRRVWWELLRHLLKLRFSQARIFWGVLLASADSRSAQPGA